MGLKNAAIFLFFLFSMVRHHSHLSSIVNVERANNKTMNAPSHVRTVRHTWDDEFFSEATNVFFFTCLEASIWKLMHVIANV